MRGDVLSGRSRIAGVLGWPIRHSLSPRLHGYWFRHYGIDGALVPLEVRPEDLSLVLTALPKLGFVGASVTIPHKEAALPSMDDVTAQARRIGAVNTIVCRVDRTLLGDNTDAFGFIESLRGDVPGWRADAGPALILGAGGAARAVCAGLLDAGTPMLRLCNRNAGRAHAIASLFPGSIEVVPWAERNRAVGGAALIVNTTALGMLGQPPLALDLADLSPAAVVTDLVYRPLMTPLLATAEARGNLVVDGLGMLLHQARPAFAAWFGVVPEVTPALRTFVLQEAEEPCSSSD